MSHLTLKEKAFIKSLNKIIKEMENLQKETNEFCGVYADKQAFDNAYFLMQDVRNVIETDL